ncbi:MAG: type I-E CRISPR-associated endonuclease Cas1 [Dehalococcoidia bacterium]|nr:type I-E CRISPR-associated endonuclease Cas1 [Dehalococcoidia bacterium]
MNQNPLRDLHLLPKVRDSLTYLYAEHCRVDQDDKAIALRDAQGKTPVPCASLTALILGPGTTITHAAIHTLADSGCLVLWAGENGVRFYAQGMGETRSARNLLHQARLWANPTTRLEVVMRMYRIRFKDPLPDGLTLQQIRGKEGIRVREAYARASRETGVTWTGRSYQRQQWASADPVNRALSAANSCLYGICHAAIVSAGYSPALGFVHTGKLLSFVYDVADLYKADVSIPLAFRAAAEAPQELERWVRRACRDLFYQERLLARMVPDIQRLLSITPEGEEDSPWNNDAALPGGLWSPTEGVVAGGINYGEEVELQEMGAADGRDDS